MPDTAIAAKLQVKGTRSLCVIGAAADLEALIGAGEARTELGAADVVLLFVADRGHLEAHLAGWLAVMKRDAILWLAYPKLTSKLAVDLNRDLIREDLAPRFGLDTVSQIALDSDWSALRLKVVDRA